MSGLKLYDAGFTDVVSVIPPDATLSPNSSINPSQLGKTPGLYDPQRGVWYGYPFTSRKATAHDAETWDVQQANIGLLGDRFPGLDVDVNDDPQLSAAIVAFARARLGEAPTRLSNGPRRLLVYRADTPFQRVAAVIQRDGKSHLVEMLGQGRQYVVSGVHPSGAKYRWDGPALWELEPDDLPIVTPATVSEFFAELKAKLEERGMSVELIGAAKTRGDAPDQESLLAPSYEKLAVLVADLPNPDDCDRAMYVQIAAAIKAAAGADAEDAARALFTQWAAEWRGGVADALYDAQTWDSLKPPYRVGWTWLQELATAWTPTYSAAQDDFEPEAGAEPPPETVKVPKLTTDEQVVAALLPQLRERLRFAPRTREWLVWDVYRWRRDEVLTHELVVRELLAGLTAGWRAAAKGASKAAAKELNALADRYQSANGVRSVLDMTRAHLACRPDDFDRDLMVLNTPGGALDLRTGELRASAPADLLSRSTSVAPSSGPSPLWDRFLSDLTGGDRQMIRYLQTWCGYCLTGDVSEKVLSFIWGSDSDTGKSTFIRVLQQIMGDYADAVDVQAFIGTNRDRIPAELARLPGVRLVTATEPAAGHSWDEKRIKAITGGDTIEVRFLHGQPFTYQPQFKILIVGNHEPEIRTVDDAMLRRIHIVPFNRKVPREKQVDNLARLLVEREGRAILAWMVDGFARWRDEGLVAPDVVLKKTREYAAEEDALQAWIDEQCELAPEHRCSRDELYRAWVVWCHERGEDAGKLKTFKRRLAAKIGDLSEAQVTVDHSRLRGFRGVRLAPGVASGAMDFA